MCGSAADLEATDNPDCSLRQGARGIKTARVGSRTCLLSVFYNRSEAYFGQESKEHVTTIKKTWFLHKSDDL